MQSTPNRGLNPFRIFICMFVIINVLPLVSISFKEDYIPRVLWNGLSAFNLGKILALKCNLTYFLIFLLSYFLLNLKTFNKTFYVNNTYTQKVDIYFYLLVVSLIFLTIYISFGGSKKIFLLGQEYGNREFRLIGFDDVPRSINYLLQVARRMLLPICIFHYSKAFLERDKKAFVPMVISNLLQVIATMTTLSRSPLVTHVAVLVFAFISSNRKLKVPILLAGAMIVIPFIGYFTGLQYNNVEVGLRASWEMGLDFFFNRVFLATTNCSIDYSFGMFVEYSDKLVLEYSRLSVLIGKSVTGTNEINSIFVTPVGLVGDIWRNFGSIGIFVHACFMAQFTSYCQSSYKRYQGQFDGVKNLIFFIVVSYWLFGVFFSLGGFFCVVICFYTNKIINYYYERAFSVHNSANLRI